MSSRHAGGSVMMRRRGLVPIARTLALELAPRKIAVRGVAPGMILTPMNQFAIDNPDELHKSEAIFLRAVPGDRKRWQNWWRSALVGGRLYHGRDGNHRRSAVADLMAQGPDHGAYG
jgi:NAD(P)-dependent dehydrogenase (short-subunit alcohol dehydrogenase family)